jgi:hypothetical protein
MSQSKVDQNVEIITKYMVFCPSLGQWYRGSHRFDSQFKKAKVYNRMSDAKNAITTYKEYENYKPRSNRKLYDFEVYVYEIQQVTSCKDIIRVPR